MLKWEHADEHAGNDPYARARSDRWIVFLFFMMGLSIGVHLLNLLTIPAIVMIYYYRRYQATTKGAIHRFFSWLFDHRYCTGSHYSILHEGGRSI